VTKKWGEKKGETIFPEKQEWCQQKMFKKSSQKVRRHVFYIHTNIVNKKWGEKRGETIFPEKHE